MNIDPVIDRPTSQDVGQSTVIEENLDLTSKSHVKTTQVQSYPTVITNSEDMNHTPSVPIKNEQAARRQ